MAAPRVDVLGVGFDRVDLGGATEAVLARLARGERTFVITGNPEFVMLARRDPSLAALARDADLVVPDGTGIVLGARVLGDPLPGRAPGRMLADLLAAQAARDGRSIYLLGAAPGVAERAAQALGRRHPGLRVVGASAGSPEPAEDAATTARIAAAAPEILLVAYGLPLQERWIARNLGALPSVRVAIGVGGVLDQLVGLGRVPPSVVHAVGLEWLWRLAREPRRWRRQGALWVYAYLVLRTRIASGRRWS